MSKRKADPIHYDSLTDHQKLQIINSLILDIDLDFIIKSIGVFTNKEIVLKSINIINKRLNNLKQINHKRTLVTLFILSIYLA